MPEPVFAFCYYSCTRDIDGAERWHQRMLPRLLRSGLQLLGIQYRVTSGACRLTGQLREHGIRVREVDAVDVAPGVGLWRLLKVLNEERPTLVSPNHLEVAAMSAIWCKPAGMRYLAMIRDDYELFWNLADRFVWGDDQARVHGVACVSQELYSMVKLRIDDSIHTLQCPSSVIPTDKIAAWHADPFHVIYLGRIDNAQKRIDALAAQLIRLSRAWPWLRATLYGDGPDLPVLLEKLATQTGHQVRYGGNIADDAVYRALQSSQALVLFSAHEGLSTAMQEAMMNGVPVVLKKMSSGFNGIVKHGTTAWVLDQDEDLDDALSTLRMRRDQWMRLSRGGRELAMRKFSIDLAAERWASFLRHLAEGAETHAFALPTLDEIEQVWAKKLATWQPQNIYERWLITSRDQLPALIEDTELAPRERVWLLELSIERAKIDAEHLGHCLSMDWPPDVLMSLLLYAIEHNIGLDKITHIIESQRLPLQRRAFLLHRLFECASVSGDRKAVTGTRLIMEYEQLTERSLQDTYNLSSLYRLTGQLEAATKLFKQVAVTTTDPQQRAGCMFHLAALAVRRGDLAGARSTLQNCLQLMPTHDRAQQLLEQIDAGEDQKHPDSPDRSRLP